MLFRSGLTCRDRLNMIYVENRLPPETSLLRMDIGVRLPMATTSAGRAYYCAVSEQERKFIDDTMLEKYGPEDWIEKKNGLEIALKDYQKHGFCLSIGDWDRNINSAGVPITLHDGTIMILNCAAASYLVSEEMLRESIAHRLAMLAGDIQSLGV